MKRQLIEISTSVIHDINIDKEAMSSVEYVSEIEKQLANLVVYNEYNRDSQLISGLAQSAIEKISFNMHNKHELTGLTTGFSQLDRMLGGMQKSDLIIIAARPAMGKTSFALCLALNAAEYMRDKADDEKKGSVGFVSLEMSGEQLVTRLISMKSMVNSMKMRSGHINEDEFAKITLATNNLRELDLVIDDNAAISMSELKSKVRRMVLKNKISILFIDYLQLLHGSKKSSDTSRVNEISEISRGLKQIAKELNIPVIALSQLSREIEKREDKMPRLSDLRESGSIEQDADIVMFIHREEYYLRRKEPKMNADEGNSDGEQSEEGYKMTKNKVPFEDKMEQWQKDMESVLGKAEIIIAKHRNGPVGNIELRFDSNTTAFIDPTKYTEDEFFEDESFE
jgi:replicative DNA helicase